MGKNSWLPKVQIRHHRLVMWTWYRRHRTQINYLPVEIWGISVISKPSALSVQSKIRRQPRHRFSCARNRKLLCWPYLTACFDKINILTTILQAAASQNKRLEITVSVESHGQWIKELGKQKFREGVLLYYIWRRCFENGSHCNRVNFWGSCQVHQIQQLQVPRIFKIAHQE